MMDVMDRDADGHVPGRPSPALTNPNPSPNPSLNPNPNPNPDPNPNPIPDPNPIPNPNPITIPNPNSTLALRLTLREGKHHRVKWTVVPLCVEVGARGAINDQPWNWMCKRLGFSKCSKLRLTQVIQDAVVACSYYIFLCCFLRTWEPHALVDTLERSER